MTDLIHPFSVLSGKKGFARKSPHPPPESEVKRQAYGVRHWQSLLLNLRIMGVVTSKEQKYTRDLDFERICGGLFDASSDHRARCSHISDRFSFNL